MGAEERWSTGSVFFWSALCALVGGIGGLPFFSVTSLSSSVLGSCNAIASGVMVACSFDLLREAEPFSAPLAALGCLAGVLLVNAQQNSLGSPEDALRLHQKHNRKRSLLLCTMAAHALGEGAGVGASFRGPSGPLVTLAMALHNVPEGLAVAAILFAHGDSPSTCTLWAALTSLPQALSATPCFAFIGLSRLLVPPAMGFAAGCMLQLSFSEVLPDAMASLNKQSASTIAVCSAIALEMLRCALSSLSTLSFSSLSGYGAFSTTSLMQLAKAVTAATVPTNAITAAAIALPFLICRSSAALSHTRLRVVLTSAAFAHLIAFAGIAVLFSPHRTQTPSSLISSASTSTSWPSPGVEWASTEHLSSTRASEGSTSSTSSVAAGAGSAAAGAIAHALAHSAFTPGTVGSDHPASAVAGADFSAPVPTIASAAEYTSPPSGEFTAGDGEMSDMEEGTAGGMAAAATATAAAAACAAYAYWSKSVSYQHAVAMSVFAFVDGAEHASLALCGFTMRAWVSALVRAVPKGLSLAASAMLAAMTTQANEPPQSTQLSQPSSQRATKKALVLASIVSTAEQAGALCIAAGVLASCPVRLRQLAGGAAVSLALRSLVPKARSRGGLASGAAAALLPPLLVGSTCSSTSMVSAANLTAQTGAATASSV